MLRLRLGIVQISLFILFGVLALLAGCTVGPDYVRPTVETPPNYKEMTGWKVASPNDESIRQDWWVIFNDPLLNDLEAKVTISNQNVAAAEARFRGARTLVQGARAGYSPVISTDPSVTRSKTSANTARGSSAGATSDYLLPLSVSWEPDVWGRIAKTVEASVAGAQASASDLQSALLSAQAELAQAYFQLRTLDAQKQILDSTIDYYKKHLELTNNRYASGVASRGDILLAETQLKTTQAQAIDLGVARATTEHAIALLVGAPASTFSIAVGTLDTILPEIPVGLPSELLERRPDIASAERLVAAANAQIGVAQSAFFPTISLTADGGLGSSLMGNLLTWPSHLWSLGAALSETIFDGGSSSARTEQALAAYDATVASYRQGVLAAFQEVEDYLATLKILEKEAVAQEEAVAASRKSLDFTINQYKAGTVSYLNVIVAQATLLGNETTATNIIGRRLTATVLLIKAIGGGVNACATSNIDKPGNEQRKREGGGEASFALQDAPGPPQTPLQGHQCP
ncbi:MAG: efflux transporter outer membrane subunit [Nitrospirae bacterium]|nr:efflux transporter outer membrane subunit [Nitrospirota bacterium]